MATLAAAAYWLPSLTLISAGARRVFRVRATVHAGSVALTFDDGPHSDGTPAILDVLDREGALGTFFLVGEQVERRPRLAAEILAAGHAIGIHCFHHRQLMWLTPGQATDDLERAYETIMSATGDDVRFYRPPYGILTTAALLHARRNDWETVLWRRDGCDWQQRATPDSIAARILDRLEGGDVLLLHDSDAYSAPGSWRKTADALPRIIERVRGRGLELGPL